MYKKTLYLPNLGIDGYNTVKVIVAANGYKNSIYSNEVVYAVVPTPQLEINGGMVTITFKGNIATSCYILENDSILSELSNNGGASITFSVHSLGLSGTHTITAIATRDGYLNSFESGSVTYTIIQTPIISLVDHELRIDNTTYDDGMDIEFVILCDGKVATTTNNYKFDLSSLGITGSHEITVVVKGAIDYLPSHISDPVTYAVVPKPEIRRNNHELAIIDNSGIAESFDIYVDGKYNTTTTYEGYYLDKMGIAGSHVITVQAKATNYLDSPFSDPVDYKVVYEPSITLDEHKLIITDTSEDMKDRAEKFEISVHGIDGVHTFEIDAAADGDTEYNLLNLNLTGMNTIYVQAKKMGYVNSSINSVQYYVVPTPAISIDDGADNYMLRITADDVAKSFDIFVKTGNVEKVISNVRDREINLSQQQIDGKYIDGNSKISVVANGSPNYLPSRHSNEVDYKVVPDPEIAIDGYNLTITSDGTAEYFDVFVDGNLEVENIPADADKITEYDLHDLFLTGTPSITVRAKATGYKNNLRKKVATYEEVISLAYELSSDGTYYTCVGIGDETYTDIMITSTINGKPVRAIGNGAFRDTSLTSVRISDSVTSIGNSAFWDCSNLTSVVIGNGVTTISSGAFYGCPKLSIVNIKDIAAWCKINFADNNSNPLTYAKKPYMNGEFVTELVIPGSATSIGNYVFYGCSDLTSVTIPDSVTSIGKAAFNSCSNLTSVTIPNSVTSIGGGAFSGCTGLTSVTIGKGVTTIGDRAFQNCTGLTGVYINSLVAWCNISHSSADTNPLYYAKNLYYNGNLVTNLIIPDGVTSIGMRAFYGCTSIRSVSIPNSVRNIYAMAFGECGLRGVVTIPGSVETISYGMFYKCVYIGEIVMQSGVKQIVSYAFQSCTSLTDVTIPSSVTVISEGAFSNCGALDHAIFGTTTGWKAGSTSISSSVLIDARMAAQYLTNNYLSYEWTRS